MDIRPALLSQAPALAAIGARLFRTTYAGQIPDREIDSYVTEAFHPAAQRAEISAAGGTVLVAMAGTELAGFAQLRPTPCPGPCPDPAPLEVARFYLDTPWHGQGLAADLMDACQAWAAAQGRTGLWLQVWEENPRAIRFYQKQRFQDYGETSFQVGSILYRDRVMARQFQSNSVCF